MVIARITKRLPKKRIRRHVKQARKEAVKIKKRVLEKLTILVTAAFGLVAALAWNDAIKHMFKQQGWMQDHGPWVYALAVTFIAVFITVWLGYVSERMKS